MSRTPHCPAFPTASTKYVMIPSSFFAHVSEAGQTDRSSKLPSVQPDHFSRVQMSFASQQAARLAQQRAEKRKEAMTKGTESTCTSSSTKVSSMTSSSPSTTSSSRINRPSASSTGSSIPSSSSQGSQDIGQAIKTLRNLEDRLHDFLIMFRVPDHLDFISTHLDPQYSYQDTQNGPLTHLSITSHNSPVIALGELLKSLEQELSFVEAHGNQYIEVRRNKIANRIKKTTAFLEEIVHDLWWIALSKQA